MSDPSSPADRTAPEAPGHPETARLVVPARFNGPPGSGNGGWVAGAVAALLHPDAGPGRGWPSLEVTLSAPPPLEVPLSGPRDRAAGTLALADGDRPVARARPTQAEPQPVDPVTAERARAATAEFLAAARPHPFPTCLVCGPERAAGDGMRIFPGPVGPRRVAATWTPGPADGSGAPDGHATLPLTWAALDCSGAWAGGFGEVAMVLGRMTARVRALPRIGAEHVVVGEARRTEGRKTFAATSLYDPAGTLLASAEQVWFTVPGPPAG